MRYLYWLILPIIFLTYFFYPQQLPPSPLATAPALTPVPPERYVVLGFAPYWLRDKITAMSLAGLTDYAYFALLLDGSGKLLTHVNRREQEPGYTNYLRLLQNLPDKPLTLTFMPESQAALVNLLASPLARQTAISTINKALSESSANGVNIDFEPLGNTSDSLRNNFVEFIKALKDNLCQQAANDCPQLSISIYPSAASRPRLWDLPRLASIANYFVVMAYDYTLPSADKVGPIAPLRGAGQLFEHDIIQNLSELTRQVPPHQLLLGIPFYGYEWKVISSDKYTTAKERGVVASLSRINELINNHELELLWDRNTLSPYALRLEGGKVVSQIYFEDSLSLKLKLELVKSAHLGGIAIWALGYEGNNPRLWQTIQSLQTP